VIGIVITNPDNPTGHTLTDQEQVALGKAALEAGIAFVLYDWVYHYVTDEKPMDLNAFLKNFDAEERKHIIFLDAITKSLGASNIRNAHLIASEDVIKFIVSRASHAVIPDFYGQAVAMAAYEMGFAEAAKSINEPTNASRILLKAFLEKHGFKYIIGKGYYAFIHVGKWIEKRGWKDSEPMGQYMAEEHGVAIVPGAFFSIYGGDWIRFSYATPPERTQGAAERLIEGLKALEG
jgi:aspartate/methionine/tyrosine aminotransferase